MDPRRGSACIQGNRHRCVAYLMVSVLGAACETSEIRSAFSPAVTDTRTPTSPSDSLTGLPCEVQSILVNRCQLCHNQNLDYGAPMPLTRWDDFQSASPPLSNRTVAELVRTRIHDPVSPMPPPNQRPLSAGQRATLDDWLAGGAERSDQDCSARDAGLLDEPPAPGTTTPSTDSAVAEDPCEIRAELRAFGDEAQGKFRVPEKDNHYECFYFDNPFQEKAQLIATDALIDNKKVLHHYLLYYEPAGAEPGTHRSCLGVHSAESVLINSWAPGEPGIRMPEGVGMALPTGPDFVLMLEVHYHNSALHADASDQSGLSLCATTKLRQNEAATHWLGSEAILLAPGEGQAGSVCRPTQQAHILTSHPHMHRHGRRMTTVVTRASGKIEVLLDQPFQFESQGTYDTPMLVLPGDSLKTTCFFTNDDDGLVTFGPNTDNEMCYNFVVAYPAGALDTGGSSLGGPNKCMR